MQKRLNRSEHERMLAGVCGGLGSYFGIDPTWVRLLFVGAFLIGFGSPGLLYLLLWVLIPNESSTATTSPKHLQEGAQKMVDKTRQVVSQLRNYKNA